jgi:hypothetical protein
MGRPLPFGQVGGEITTGSFEENPEPMLDIAQLLSIRKITEVPVQAPYLSDMEFPGLDILISGFGFHSITARM